MAIKYYFVKSAKNDIYQTGKKIPADNKEGFRRDRTQPCNQDDVVLIPKGSSYFWWKFKYQRKQVSLTKPSERQLVRYGKSEWQEKEEEFEGQMNSFRDDNLSRGEIEELQLLIEEYCDELQSRLDNIPYQLQESSVLNERIEILRSMLDELA